MGKDLSEAWLFPGEYGADMFVMENEACRARKRSGKGVEAVEGVSMTSLLKKEYYYSWKEE